MAINASPMRKGLLKTNSLYCCKWSYADRVSWTHNVSLPNRSAVYSVALAWRPSAAKVSRVLVGALWSVTIAENTAKGSAAPVLTVPVSR